MLFGKTIVRLTFWKKRLSDLSVLDCSLFYNCLLVAGAVVVVVLGLVNHACAMAKFSFFNFLFNCILGDCLIIL